MEDREMVDFEEAVTPYKRGLIYELMFKRMEMSDQAGDVLDEKADRLMQLSAVITGLLGLVGVWAQGVGGLVLIPVFLVGLGFIAVIYLGQLASMPKEYPRHGPETFESAYRDFLYKTDEGAFQLTIAMLDDVTAGIREINTKKAIRLKWATIILGLQVFLLVAIVAIISS